MPPLPRQQVALIFRAKSDDAFAGAQRCYADGIHRSACARAWYAVCQAIFAGVYARLNQEAPSNKGTWNHEAVEGLFSNFLRATRIRLDHGYLVECLRLVRQARVAADYDSDESIVTPAHAYRSVIIAQRVRAVIWEAMQWPLPN